MSEWHPRVVKIGKIEKHPNADSLSLVDIEGYPVIFKTGGFNEGDLAGYIPVDTIVPKTEQFAFLDGHRRIRAARLRGIFSMGLLVPVSQDRNIGDSIVDEFQLEKFVPPEEINIDLGTIKNPGYMAEYTDIESWRRHKHLFAPDDMIVITEKIHGMNFRCVYVEGKFWVGSHHKIKEFPHDNIFAKTAERLGLHEKLKNYDNMVFYGELAGPGIQRKKNVQFTYGLKQPDIFFFDIFDRNTARYLSYREAENTFLSLGLKTTPKLSTMMYGYQLTPELITKLSNGNTVLDNHVREGIIVKTMTEQMAPRLPQCRKMVKFIGEDYLLLKS